jgi:hypothetical protein
VADQAATRRIIGIAAAVVAIGGFTSGLPAVLALTVAAGVLLVVGGTLNQETALMAGTVAAIAGAALAWNDQSGEPITVAALGAAAALGTIATFRN